MLMRETLELHTTQASSIKLRSIRVVILFTWFDFQCEEIFVPEWRYLFPEIDEIAQNQVSGKKNLNTDYCVQDEYTNNLSQTV